ncbi:DUF2256 domain-containing protein [Halomonas sp. FeN2]|uniref:DUF2256 domain-containing protein n=1 Tax=Halomonadaceae TaxID=28256 RepID=UPI000C0EFEB6|nr:DUF2256 domain-containing protein [Halomonas sp.]MBF56726.1 hypothetical protein [Halomonas sp.]MBL1270780.1 DUF2256 domain-containing protein [Halomonas sp.]UBR51996.1 DUF2256 domain-containing protein [Halomonas sp. FeN2]
MRRKQHLPQKICAHCQRPFDWRKKWARCWDEVRYCSERCRRSARQSGHQSTSRRHKHVQHD